VAEGIGKESEIGREATLPPEGAHRQQKELQWVSPLSCRLGYNPITHAYEDSSRGQALRNYDEGK
jgi:hypothetical protein